MTDSVLIQIRPASVLTITGDSPPSITESPQA